jgi:hypothetical protein
VEKNTNRGVLLFDEHLPGRNVVANSSPGALMMMCGMALPVHLEKMEATLFFS